MTDLINRMFVDHFGQTPQTEQEQIKAICERALRDVEFEFETTPTATFFRVIPKVEGNMRRAFGFFELTRLENIMREYGYMAGVVQIEKDNVKFTFVKDTK